MGFAGPGRPNGAALAVAMIFAAAAAQQHDDEQEEPDDRGRKH